MAADGTLARDDRAREADDDAIDRELRVRLARADYEHAKRLTADARLAVSNANSKLDSAVRGEAAMLAVLDKLRGEAGR